MAVTSIVWPSASSAATLAEVKAGTEAVKFAPTEYVVFNSLFLIDTSETPTRAQVMTEIT